MLVSKITGELIIVESIWVSTPDDFGIGRRTCRAFVFHGVCGPEYFLPALEFFEVLGDL